MPRYQPPRAWRRALPLLCLLPLALALLGCGRSQPTLTLLVWEGYADPSFIHQFEVSHHCKIDAAYMGSSDELIAKLRGGSASNYDVISPSSDVATQIVQAGLAAPLDLAQLPAYAQLSKALTSLPLARSQGRVYGVPFMWGPNPLLYDTRVFSTPPSSWAVLWDPQYRNKISVWDDLSTIYMAAEVLGYSQPNPDAVYNLSDAQLQTVKAKLIALKPNIRKYWSTGGELTNLFANSEIVAAMGWPLMTNQLRKRGYPIGETIPREGTTGWIDHLMITAASPHKKLATEFLQYMLTAKTQSEISAVTGYTPANPEAAQFMTAAEVHNLHLDDPAAYQSHIAFWENVPRRAQYNQIWNEVKAAP